MKKILLMLIPLLMFASFMREGIRLYKQQDYKGALQAFQNAIDEDDSINAYYFVGLFYLRGYGVKPDLEKAARFLKKAYLAGNARAACLLGEIYHKQHKEQKAKSLIQQGLREGAPECRSLAEEVGL